MKKLSKLMTSLGLLTALLVGGAISVAAASGCCGPSCGGDCHCSCCQK
jgi:hypothetical protein